MGANSGKVASPSSGEEEAYLLKLAKELYSQYHSKFSSGQVCEKLGHTLQSKLTVFSEDQLEQMAQRILEKKVTLPASFLQDFPEDLRDIQSTPPDYFSQQYINIPEGLTKKTFSIPYISQRVLDILEQQKGGLLFVQQKPSTPAPVLARSKTPQEILDQLNQELQTTLQLGKNLQTVQHDIRNTLTNKMPKIKKQIEENVCGIIAKHYMLRANMVSAIASALPLATDDPGFCQERIRALETGILCLPSQWAKNTSVEEVAESIGEYIQCFHKEQCEKKKGRFREQTFDAHSLLGKIYLQHIEAMKHKYHVFLSLLKETLEILMNKPLTNPDLYVLTQKTKDTLERFYIDCQLDYVLGIVCLLQMDSQNPPLTAQGEKNLMATLKERD